MRIDGYTAAREAAAWRVRRERRVLSVSGADRLEWLQGLLTNDIKALGGGGACYAAWLSPQGRMITDADVLEVGGETWLDVPAALAEPLAARLDSMIFAEDVRVQVSAARVVIGIYGPHATNLAERLLPGPATGIRAHEPFGLDTIHTGEGAIALLGSDHLGVPGLHVYLPAGAADALQDALAREGAPQLDEGAAEVLRVEAGRPAFTVDMTEETIPLEAGIESRAISHTKGCYVGQEIIVRLRDLAHGRVARKLVGLLVEGDRAAVGDPISVADRKVGKVTSAVRSVALDRLIALGYVHRDHTAPGTIVQIGAQGLPATITPLPFR